jgi:hypothetical protein
LTTYYATKKLPDLPRQSSKRVNNRNKNGSKKRTTAISDSRHVPCPPINETTKKSIVQGHQRNRHPPVRESELQIDPRENHDALSEPRLSQDEFRKSFQSLHESHISSVRQRRPQSYSLYPASTYSKSIYSRATNSTRDLDTFQLRSDLSPTCESHASTLGGQASPCSSCDHNHFTLDEDARRADLHTASLESSPPQQSRFRALLERIKKILPRDQLVGRRRSDATSKTLVGEEEEIRLKGAKLAADGARRRRGEAARSWVRRNRHAMKFM